MHGAIDVARVEVDGRDKYIVYLPGTDDMSPLPKGGDNARDMLTNYQLIGGMESSYGRGISEAMREAGLAGKDVMLVGHSQGGMVATSLAADPGFREEFHVQQVLTVGSPTAQVAALPSDVAALHLENRGDAVPLLDGEDNPDQARRVTVKFDLGTSDVAGNHALELYAAGARAVDASGHGSIRDAVEQMTDDGFLRGEVASPATYTVSRG
jgi:pimeloyl-ACP methyl ester carboxylesterase